MLSPTWKLPDKISTSKISLPPLSNCPECATIWANALLVLPLRYKPSRMSRPRIASAVLVVTSPVKSVRNPLVKIRNLGRSTTKFGREVKPAPLSVIVILVITPAVTTADPNAPVPPPPFILTDTRL